jgi:toxin-antitoxin system PIN domain toxin
VSTFLLDVNVLLALADPMHVHHEAAHAWFAAAGQAAWATCPLTENGFVRVASHPAYPNRFGSAAATLDLLRRFCAHPGHTFWPASISLRDLLAPGAVASHNQITDLYLLGLALHHGGKLATFDRTIPATAIAGGAAALALLDAAPPL